MDIVGIQTEADLFKARPHKYIKRTGGPGNYKYWYKMPDGRIVAEDGEMQKHGRLEHVRRLVAGRMAGIHDNSNDTIARLTGATKRQVQQAHANIQREQRRQQMRGTTGHRGHDFQDHHLQEAKALDVNESSYHDHVEAHAGSERGISARTDARRRARAAASATPGPISNTDTGAQGRAARAAGFEFSLPNSYSRGDVHLRIRVHGRDHYEFTVHYGTTTEGPYDSFERALSTAKARAESRERAAERERSPAPAPASARPRRPRRPRAAAPSAPAPAASAPAEEVRTLGAALRVRAERARAAEAASTGPASSTTGAGGTGTAAASPALEDILRKLKTEHGVDLTTPAAPADAPLAEEDLTALREAGFRTRLGSGVFNREMANGEHEIKKVGGQWQLTATHNDGTPVGRETTIHSHGNIRDAIDNSRRIQARRGRERFTTEQNLQADAEELAAAARARAQAASARAQVRNQAIHPDGAAARQLAEADPEFARAEEPVRAMLDAEASGENPYLHRAKGIYNRIKADIKPERKQIIEHVLQSIEALKTAGQPLNEANLLSKYKELSGRRVQNLGSVSEEFEKGTFVGLDEVLENKPVDIEVERMKRGFAAKQFARLQPYLSEAFKSQHPGAPPPFPTYNDLKSWAEHGSSRPAEMSWTTPTGRAGGVSKAMPPEFFNSIQKIDGKPAMPPPDLPLHLVPAWNYVVKKTAGDGSTYATGAYGSPVGQDGKISAGNQAKAQEGVYRSAMRKYVQMRGENNLVDIPHSKLSEMGLTHADIFKAGRVDLRRKIIDPVALIPFIDAELKKGVKKSWSLVVGDDQPIFKSVTKAQLIAKIKQLKGLR